MATSFDSITELMLMELKRKDIIQMDSDIAYSLISNLILTGATVDFNDCIKDLNLYVEYTELTTELKIDVDKAELIIERKNDVLDSILLRVDDINIEEFDYKFTDTEVIITYPFIKGNEVTIIEYFKGEFYEDLNHREKYIIALAANCHYLNQDILKEDNLKMHLGDKDYKATSNFVTLKQLVEVKKYMDEKLEDYIYKYNNDSISVEDLM